MLEFYKSNEAEYLNFETSITDDMGDFTNPAFSPSCAKMLKDWMIDISLSEKYYQQKYAKSDKRKAIDFGLEDDIFRQSAV